MVTRPREDKRFPLPGLASDVGTKARRLASGDGFSMARPVLASPPPRAHSLAILALLALAACGSAGDPPPDAPEPACVFHADCGRGVCKDGACLSTLSCRERADCATAPACADGQCFCDEATLRCLPACLTDLECGTAGHCVDGVCAAWPAPDRAGQPATLGTPGLKAGAARVDLDYPMGVSLAGYGARAGPSTPYQAALGGSSGWFDRPDVRALALDDGDEVLVVLRTPTCWSTDFFLTTTARKVLARTGLDLQDRIVSSAPHSHAQPARYWHLLRGLGFGAFGYDAFSWEVFERLTDSFADAVVAALEARAPARLGYVVIDGYDPGDDIARDRRGQNNGLEQLQKDDRMVVLRVDDAAGEPLAVLVHLGIHGTVFGGANPIITGDAGGGIEVELTHAASAKYGREVLGFFLQGNAGDLSPDGDDRGHSRFERIQLLGRRAWRVVEPALDRLETRDVDLDLQVARVPLTRDTLGYEGKAFFQEGGACFGAPEAFRYGAFKCVESGVGQDDDPSTRYVDGQLACLTAVECLTDGRPVPQFMKTTIAVGRVGDLAIVTSPGEPVSAYGRDLSDRVTAAVPGARAGLTLGYAMDHHFYLLSEADWFQGGYAPSMGIWGWRLAPVLADRAVELAVRLDRPPADRVPWAQPKPTVFFPGDDEPPPVGVPNQAEDPAEVLTPAPAVVQRLDELRFGWRGGHPGVDLPHVVLEREAPVGFAPVQRPGGWIYDDAGFEMLVRYGGQCNDRACVDHRWRVRWQERRDFPVGRYRLRVEGRARRGGELVSYQVRSQAFELRPSTRLAVDARLEGDRLQLRVAEPPAVLRDGERASDGGLLLRSEDTPSRIGAALPEGERVQGELRIRGSEGEARRPIDGTLVLARERRNEIAGFDPNGAPQWRPADREYDVGLLELPLPSEVGGGPFRVELELSDAYGNRGTLTATVGAR